MAISANTVNDRIPDKPPEENPTDTAKQNYTEVGWGNDKGSIRLGHIHKQGDVTAGVILQTPDAEHQLSLDRVAMFLIMIGDSIFQELLTISLKGN